MQNGEDIFDETKNEAEDETQIEIPQEKRKNIHCCLRGLQVLEELNNKSFKELDKPIQRALEGYGLQTIVITKDSDNDVKFALLKQE